MQSDSVGIIQSRRTFVLADDPSRVTPVVEKTNNAAKIDYSLAHKNEFRISAAGAWSCGGESGVEEVMETSRSPGELLP